jgi:hypothetical protein
VAAGGDIRVGWRVKPTTGSSKYTLRAQKRQRSQWTRLEVGAAGSANTRHSSHRNRSASFAATRQSGCTPPCPGPPKLAAGRAPAALGGPCCCSTAAAAAAAWRAWASARSVG